MKRYVLIGMVMVCALAGLYSPQAHASSLRITPLDYGDVTLVQGEKKKGFVDVTNPQPQPATISMTVQSFRQTDDQGTLEFFDDSRVRSGIRLDLDSFELRGYETMRVYFLLDSNALPKGDVFGVIMATTVPVETGGVTQSIRVGTLLTISNGSTAVHRAEIVGLSTNWLQVGDGLSATLLVKNPDALQKMTGFSPSLKIATRPFGTTTVKGPLIFAGRTRTVEYRQPGNYFGPIYVHASVGSSSKGQFIFAVTGYWRWLAPLIGVLGLLAILVARGAGARFKRFRRNR